MLLAEDAVRLPQIREATTGRIAAWLAITRSQQEISYVEQTVNGWQGTEVERRLARELASGTVRWRLTLDHWLAQAAERGLSSLGQAERALLRMTVYQLAFCDRIPPYAAVDESVSIARRYGHPRFAAFVNAVCRKLTHHNLTLPAMASLRASLPPWFIEQLCASFDRPSVESVLTASNRPAPLMARERPTTTMRLLDAPVVSEHLYIQNRTPVELLTKALAGLDPPQRILDLCAAPGGKAILAHDLFPKAELHVNDVSRKKRKRIEENLARCGIDATIHTGPGEHFCTGQLFDLIIVDAPCSNSGVLAKRPEARWRLSADNLAALVHLQHSLLAQARTLLAPGGTLCYLTCSILPQENEGATAWDRSWTQLPDDKGHDGGFAATMRI